MLLPVCLNAQAPDTIWTRRYNGPGNNYDNAKACAVDSLGNLYVTGSSSDGTYDACLTIKYDATGDTLWTHRNDVYTWGYGCVVDGSGNIYVAGTTWNSNLDVLTIKYSTSGDILWTRSYNGPANDADGANACAVDGLDRLFIQWHGR
jgi:hypothetical protein